MQNELTSKDKLNRMIKISLLSAIAIILMYLEFPIIPAFGWLKMDFSDVPALMGAFAFGPLAGVVIEGLKNILILVVKGTQSGFVGELANFIMGVALILPASIIYERNKTKKSAIIGMIVGAVCIQVAAILANTYLLLPAFGMKMTGEALKDYILFGLLPINGIKALSVSVITFVLYKKLSVSVFKAEPMRSTPARAVK